MPVIRIRRGTTSQWSSSTKVLQVAELGIDTTLNKVKSGDGVSLWSDLPWIHINQAELESQALDTLSSANLYTDEAVASLGNTSDSTYVLLSDVGNPDGVASLDSEGKIPDSEIPSIIIRDTDLASSISTAIDSEVTNRNTAISAAISTLVDSAPATLNTLNELAASLGDDPNFATTITNSLANKLDSSVASSVYLTQSDAATTYFSKLEAQDKVDNDLPSIDYYVTNSGSGAYLINGISNGRIDFEKGKRYRIFVYAPGHPFWIQTVSGGYSEINVYTQGVTGAGTQDGSILIELPQNAPDNLYYACQFHPSMSGSIYVQEANYLASKDYVNTVSYNAVVEGMEHTVSVNDIGNMTEFTSNSSILVTIPDDPTDSDFPIGSVIEYRQMGSGRIEFVATSPAVLVSTDGYRKTRTQYSGIMLEKRSTNSWILVGDIDA